MKIRRLRKRQQSLFKRHRAYYWSVHKLANRIFEAYAPVAKAFEQAYAKGSFHSVIIDDGGEIRVVEIPRLKPYTNTSGASHDGHRDT